MNSRLLTIVVGLSLLMPAWVGLFSSGVPTLYCPLPTLTIVPAFLLGNWHLQFLAVLVPTILFFLWNPTLLRSRPSTVPKRTIALLGLLSILTIADFVFEWKYGTQYRGERHTLLLYIINLAWLTFLWWSVARCRRQPSFKGTLLSHWLLFAWLAWYAFPYLGELP
jgi:hypothetical protein